MDSANFDIENLFALKLDKKRIFAYYSVNSIFKPTIERSSINTLSIESRRWWNCDVKVYCEWTHEGDAEIC